MTRTTDDLQESERWQPLGEKVIPPPVPKPEPKGVGPSGIVTDADGRMRTTTHKENRYL